METKRVLLSFGVVVSIGLAGTAWAGGDVQAGKAKSGSCAACHGANGEGTPSSPGLAGMKKDRFEKAMKDYKVGKRENAIMKPIAGGLGDKDIDDLAAYYASLKGGK